MEEAQKRKERLKAMRIEADGAATVDANADRSGVLSNPFVEGESASTSAPTQYSSPRFDFYTDPMAAFSGTRRESITPQVPHGHANMLPSNFYCLLFVSRDGFYSLPGIKILLLCSSGVSRVDKFTKCWNYAVVSLWFSVLAKLAWGVSL